MDRNKTKQQLIEELAEIRRRVALLDGVDAERNRAEEALRQSEGRYRALAESTKDIIFILDEQGTLLYANRAASLCIGIPVGDIVGKRQVDLFPPDLAQSQIEKIGRVFATGEVIEYDDLFHFGPAVVWLRIHLIPIRDEAGQITTVMGVCHNITGQKLAELSLVEREARLLEAQEVANLGFYVVDLKTGCCTTSSVLDRIFGVPVDYLRTIDGWANLLHPDDRQEMLDGFKRAVDEKKPNELEYRIIRYGDKQVRWVHGLGRLQFNSEGQPVSMLGTIQDITERKLAEEALRESEERLRLLVEAIPQPIWRSDADGNVIEFNRRWHEYTGQTAEEAKGSGWTKALHSDEAAMVVNKVRGGITSGAAIEIVNRLRRASDGSYRWHLARAVPMNDRGGKIIGWFGCATDIDDQKRAEEALRLSEEALQKAHDDLEQRVKERTTELAEANENIDIFRKFAEDSDEGFGMSEFDGRIVYANSTLCRLFGERKPEDVIGKNVAEYYPEEYMQRRKKEVIPALLREGHLHIEQSVLPRHGKPILTRQSTFLIRAEDGTPFRIAVVISDITDQKRAEDALRASEERFRVTFEEAPVGMVIGEGDGIITKANRALCRMSGYSPEELVGRHVRDLTHPEDRELSSPLVKRLMAGEIPSFTLEKRYLRKDGQPFWAQATTAMAHNPGGKIAFALGVVEDITERKRTEEALRREHRNLKHLLHSSDHERQLIAYEIHDGLAQELAAAIMQFDAFEHLKETKPKQAADAFNAAMTMLRQGYSEARRLIAGVRPPILDEEGIGAAVSHLVHEHGRHKGAKIEYHTSVDFDRLDPTLENAIYRIVQEALTNARQHSKSKRISVGLLQLGNRLRIEIRDWGVGFNPKAVPTNHFGLEGIRQRARLLGGKCRIRSKAGKGTSISVELPVVPRDEE